MKILVVSLLRGGDLLMQQPLLAQLSKRGEVHLLLNDEVSWVAELLPEIKHKHIFPRRLLQRWMGEADHHLLKAPAALQKQIDFLNQQSFDEILNFTHTRLSAFLMEELRAPVKLGLRTEGPKFLGVELPWAKLFNERFAAQIPFPFHYTEILAKIFSIPIPPPMPADAGPVRRIFLQALTSDRKKDWGLSQFRQLMDLIYDMHPEIPVQILAAKDDDLSRMFLPEELCTDRLSDLNFNNEDLVISGDTAVVHLAARAGAKVLCLALGSSDPVRTGPWSQGAMIMTGKVDCAPCAHSKPCPHMSHLCANLIRPAQVARVVQAVVKQSPLPEFVQVSRFDKNHGQFLTPMQLLHKVLWLGVMEPQRKERAMEQLNEMDMDLLILKDTQEELRQILVTLQNQFEQLIKKLGTQEVTVNDVQQARHTMSQVRTCFDVNKEWIWSFKDLSKIPFASPLHFLSAYQDKLEQLKAVVFERQNFINEKESHESRAGEVSADRSVEA